MKQDFKIVALNDSEFKHLFEMSDEELLKVGAVRMIADKKPGFPCRVSLKDAEIGDEVILTHYNYHNVESPYRGNGPIFVRKTTTTYFPQVNEIPEMLLDRLLSIRAYNSESMMIDARVDEGKKLRETISEMFGNQDVKYLHIHNARPGCFNCSVERA